MMKSEVYLLLVIYLNIITCYINRKGINATYINHTPNKSWVYDIHSIINAEDNTSIDVIEAQVFVSDTLYCEKDKDCRNGKELTSRKPICLEDNTCGCYDSCLIYTYYVYGMYGVFEFHCGECGQLGSECGSEVDCEYPGICSRKDHYCHCPVGEHKENICIVIKTRFLSSMLVYGFSIFGITFLCGCGYQCCMGYRLYGNWRWWQNIRTWRRDQRQATVLGPAKSPAFTTTMNMFSSNVSESQNSSVESNSENEPSTSSGIRHSSFRRDASVQATINEIRRIDSQRNSSTDM